MGNRATDGDVRDIRASKAITCYDPFIVPASLLVDDLALANPALEAPRLQQVEIYLAAHYANLADPRLASETFEKASKKFEGRRSARTGIMSSQYGQTANMLSGGWLALLDAQPVQMDFA